MYEWSKTWEIDFNAKECHVLKMGKSGMRSTWTYKLGQNIISIEKEDKDLGMVIQQTSYHHRNI